MPTLNQPKRLHAAHARVISSCQLRPEEMVWVGKTLQALTELNLHIPPVVTVPELRELINRTHKQAWDCTRLVQSRIKRGALQNRHKSRLFTITNKLRPLL